MNKFEICIWDSECEWPFFIALELFRSDKPYYYDRCKTLVKEAFGL